MRRFLLRFDEVMGRLAALERPTLAVVNGHAVAGGTVLLLACDYRLGATQTATGKGYVIGLKESAIGLPVPRVVTAIVQAALGGSPWMMEILLTGQLFTPEQAQARGMIHRLVPAAELRAAAEEEAGRFAQGTARAARHLKRAFRADLLAHRERYVDDAVFLDTWFSPETRRRVEEVVQDLRR